MWRTVGAILAFACFVFPADATELFLYSGGTYANIGTPNIAGSIMGI